VRQAYETWPLMEIFRHCARALVPVQCPGCGREDDQWCESCAALWWNEPWRCEEEAGRLCDGRAPLPVWTLAALEGPVHAWIQAWKDADRRDLDVFLASAIARATQHVSAALEVCAPLAVVPLPSRPRSIRKRGADLPATLAEASVTALASCGVSGVLRPVLSIAAGDSRGAGARDRWRKRDLSLMAGAVVPHEPVLLVDDVVTTGASLAHAVECLESKGATVVAALVLAARPRPSRNSGARRA